MCGVELVLCCLVGAGGVAAWKKRGAMTHKGSVVVDQQGRIMGKDGKLLKDKKGGFVYLKDAKGAESGETARRSAAKPGARPPGAAGGKPSHGHSSGGGEQKSGGLFSRKPAAPAGAIPVTRRSVATAKAGSGNWDPDQMAAWQRAKEK